MSLPNLDFSRPWLRLGCTLLLFSLPFSLGGWAIYNSHMHALDRQSEHSARQAVTLMETMLAHAESANRSLFPFIDQPCEQALFTLRQQVALVPFVRTVNLVGENGIYCNSLFGAIQWPDRLERYSGGRLLLLAGNQVRAHHPLLALRDSHGKGAAFSTIDGEYLRFMLVLSGRPCTLLLHVGQQWLDERGVLSEGGQPQAMLAKLQEHFSSLPSGPQPPAQRVNEPSQAAERRIVLHGEDPTAYYLQVFHAPAARHEDFPATVVLDSVLGGAKGMGLLGGSANNRSNRLYRALVETQLTVDAGCGFGPTIDPGLFTFQATLAPDVEHSAVEEAIWQEIERVQAEGVTAEELQKAIKQTRAQFVYSGESVTNRAYWLGFAAVVADLDWLDSWETRLAAVTSEDVQRVADTYLVREQQTVGWYVPESE